MHYNEQMTAFRKLETLNILFAQPAYTAHEFDLKTALKANGHAVASDTLRTDLNWLNEQGLVYIDQTSSVYVITLTARGNETREGLTSVHGVARPEPR